MFLSAESGCHVTVVTECSPSLTDVPGWRWLVAAHWSTVQSPAPALSSLSAASDWRMICNTQLPLADGSVSSQKPRMRCDNSQPAASLRHRQPSARGHFVMIWN